jgi:hypothetical protein
VARIIIIITIIIIIGEGSSGSLADAVVARGGSVAWGCAPGNLPPVPFAGPAQ